MQKKWRGINTTQKKINESNPITIINRLKQKSISLPRIDDNKRWAGYPSLAGTAKTISKLIPKSRYYVEAFAGTAKVYQELPTTKYLCAVLNDKSNFIYKWLRREFKNNDFTFITKLDFINCIKTWDGYNTVFLFDMPWHKSYYDQTFSYFNRKDVKQYDNDLLKICNKIEGKFIITTRKENQRMLQSKFNNYLIQSEYVLCGKYPKVMLTTNFTIPKAKRLNHGVVEIRQ